LAARHSGTLARPFGAGSMTLGLSLNRVSDDDYWRDFTRASGALTQRLLANDATLSWSNGNFADEPAHAEMADAARPGLAHRAAL